MFKKDYHYYNCVDKDSTLSHSERSIFKLMLGFSKYGFKKVNPAYSIIGRESGYCKRQAFRAVKRLIEIGYLIKTFQGGVKGKLRNTYKVAIPEFYKLSGREINVAQKIQIGKSLLRKYAGISIESIDYLINQKTITDLHLLISRMKSKNSLAAAISVTAAQRKLLQLIPQH